MCPPCVNWTTHNAVMCVLHVIQKLFVQTCVSTGVWRLCVFDRFSVLWGSDVRFLCDKDAEVLLWFSIFVLTVEAGVLGQINRILFLLLFWSEEWCYCEVGLLLSLRSTLAPRSPSVLSVFLILCPPHPCVLCVAPKCTEILVSNVML